MQAQYDLGKMDAAGKGVDCDFAKAKEWFEKAAEQGNHVFPRQSNKILSRPKYGLRKRLSREMHHSNSILVDAAEKDLAKAKAFSEKAAEQGLFS